MIIFTPDLHLCTTVQYSTVYSVYTVQWCGRGRTIFTSLVCVQNVFTDLHVVFVPLYSGLGCAEDLHFELHPLVLQGNRVVQHQHEVRRDLHCIRIIRKYNKTCMLGFQTNSFHFRAPNTENETGFFFLRFYKKLIWVMFCFETKLSLAHGIFNIGFIIYKIIYFQQKNFHH